MAESEFKVFPLGSDSLPQPEGFGKPVPESRPEPSRSAGAETHDAGYRHADHIDHVDGDHGADRGADPAAAPVPPESDSLAQALPLAREVATSILARFGTALGHAARLKVARAFERALVTREERRRGRKRDAAITATVADYQAGMRGQQLYQKHIRGYSGMGRYRRQSAIRRLNEAIRSRRRRDRAEPTA